MTGHSFGSQRLWTLLLLGIAVIAYVAIAPTHLTPNTPLLWDASHHYLGALHLAKAIAHGELASAFGQLFTGDLYPPGHSLWLAPWIALGGSGNGAWLAAGLVAFVITTALLLRVHPLGAALWIAMPSTLSIAPTLMVEPLALALLVASLWSVGRLAREPTASSTVLASALVVATLLTKYNIGLPLLVAIPVAAVVCTRRAQWRRFFAVSAVGTFTLALFLTLQHSGWKMFLEFARNRANSLDSSPAQRLQWYLQSFVQRDGGWAVLAGLLAGVLLLLACLRKGDRRERSEGVAALVFAVVSMIALTRHPYLLDRNLLAPTTAMIVACAAGWRAWPLSHRRAATPIVVLIALGLGLLHFDRAQRFMHFYAPPSQTELETLSIAVSTELERSDHLLVTGTFNEFSPAWVRILGLRQQRSSPSLQVDAGHPFLQGRAGISTRWDPRYTQLVKRWKSQEIQRALYIQLPATSPYRTKAYQTWNAWKMNECTALEEDRDFALTATHCVDSGIRLHTFAAVNASPRFAQGWWGAERFGQWSKGELSRLQFRVSNRPRTMSFELAIHEGFEGPQRCQVRVVGNPSIDVELEGVWQWQSVKITVPAGCDHVDLVGEVEAPTADGRQVRFALRDPWISEPQDIRGGGVIA